ncbi:MAG TPA: TylF/MycF/NovP-related O-methyltransferase [Pirellulales bacterium]|nr:TylF/MycF/NovP-related O-methyltransferase [Pirellulales bacterium]
MSIIHHPTLQKWVGGSVFERLWLFSISKVQLVLLGGHKDPQVVRLIRQVRKTRVSLQTAYELYMVHSLATAYREVPGAMAEVGVFQGASAKLLCAAKGHKTLHLFDTFEGLPKSSEHDRNVHGERQYACSLESVQHYLGEQTNVYYHQGMFPASAADVPETAFAFVHCDVDLYESTLACLRYFYPRMTKGGVMLSHDYSLLAGVKQAFAEFLVDKPERPIELPSTQCMLVKL